MHIWPLSHDYIKQNQNKGTPYFLLHYFLLYAFLDLKMKFQELLLLVASFRLYIYDAPYRSLMLLIFIVGIFHCMLHICLLFRYIMFYYRIIKKNDSLTNCITFHCLSNTLYNFCWWCWEYRKREDWYEWYYTYRNAYNLK